ncbi:zinc-binding domain-containing protein [Phaeosphaeriaceae sp. PMI808]|nr:zinc-binding domain-containing protein [Phaeosphaeriaceae sp. PMI808]
MPSKKPKSAPKWSIYPALHDDVLVLLAEEGLDFDFHEDDDDEGCIKEYDTTIMGRFICRNRACRTGGWSSRQIAITIRMYPGAQYNARVYNQHCRECDGIGKPRLTDSYAERVAYRLKKWSGIEMAQPNFSGKSKGPHESELCEGCKNGHCSQLESI